jgi:Ulp1 family protease
MLYTKDIDYYMDYPKEQDEKMCRKIHGRNPSLFYNIGFITFNNTNNPKCKTTTPRCARGKNIFDMRYIFIPIHHGLHFTCAVICMEQMKIEYYDSLLYDNVTRHGCGRKVRKQEDTPQVLRDYLQKKHMKEKHVDFPNEWKLYTMCNVPQQDTTNTTDCGVFVCMYCNFIQNDCKLDFKQDDIANSDWRDGMILSILLVKPANDKEINNDDEVTLSAINMKWNNKQKNIARASTWSTNLIMNKDCKANKDDKMDCIMMIAMADWIAKIKKYNSAFGKK